MNLQLHILKIYSMHNSFFSDACPFNHIPEHSTFITLEACLHWSVKLITVVHLLCSSIPPLLYMLSCLGASLCTTQTLILHFSNSYLVLLFNFFHLIYFIGHSEEVDIRPLLSGLLKEGPGSSENSPPHPPQGRVDRLKTFTLNRVDTLSCRVTWPWAERVNLYNWQTMMLSRNTKTCAT